MTKPMCIVSREREGIVALTVKPTTFGHPGAKKGENARCTSAIKPPLPGF